MLKAAELVLKTPDGSRLPPSAGSLLQGVLMERLDPALADMWHRPGLRPYSQHLYFDGQHTVWRVAALDSQAAEAIIGLVLSDAFTDIHLRDKPMPLAVVRRRLLYSFSYREFADRFFLGPLPSRRIRLRFETPTSFKSDNAYMIYPSVFHILQSLYNRWDRFASRFSLSDPEALAHMAEHVRIASYRLRMAPFSLEGVRIPAFQGEVELAIRGPEALARLAAMLLAYSELAGIGVKTAIGMGGSRVWAKQRGSSGLASLLAPSDDAGAI